LPLMPAKAGIQYFAFSALDSRFRGNERKISYTVSGVRSTQRRSRSLR
jgi:hypothetical protein